MAPTCSDGSIAGLLLAQPRVQLVANAGATDRPAPAWAGADIGSRVLEVDGLGDVISRRLS